MTNAKPTRPKVRLTTLAGIDYLWPGDGRGADWGYTEQRWAGSYLVLDRDRVLCSLLHASEEGRGYFRTLLRGIERSGYRVAVPVPMGRMQAILEHYGFVPHEEKAGQDPVDVWERPAWQTDPASTTTSRPR